MEDANNAVNKRDKLSTPTVLCGLHNSNKIITIRFISTATMRAREEGAVLQTTLKVRISGGKKVGLRIARYDCNALVWEVLSPPPALHYHSL